MTTYRLSAQPIHEDGSLGFDDRDPITAQADNIFDAFAHVAERILLMGGEFDAWDLTLELGDAPPHV